jgi:hypothetical protein
MRIRTRARTILFAALRLRSSRAGLAYAIVGRLPPIYGLYTSVVPSLVYLVLGQSRELSVGACRVVSRLAVKERACTDGLC